MRLSVRLVPVGASTLVIALTGELDSTTGPVLAAFLDPLPASAVKYVIVAAGDLWFCDLNGLAQFAATHRAMQAKGGYLAVAEPQPPLHRLIALMTEQAPGSIPMYTSMPEALAGTDVEIYETTGPPTPVGRHLPRLRHVPRPPAGGRTRRSPLPRAEREAEREEAELPPIIHRSRTLRAQIAQQQQTMALRLDTAHQARTALDSTRRLCGDSLQAMRVNLVRARSAMDRRPQRPQPVAELDEP
ncbi:STAS domain-containing protein [Nonomuraea sp. NPDC046802]|uniref:STAS domain-containing protein n=1 Tax=Nonomuraea sp. NPDC046802 TaxID=3154919 RepID=UPI00340BD307